MQIVSSQWKSRVRDEHRSHHLAVRDARMAKCRVRMATEPECPPSHPNPMPGCPTGEKQPPRLWVVKPMPKTQALVFPGEPNTFEAVQAARANAAVAEKSASLTDELNRQVWERVQAKRAARAAAQ